MRLGADMSDVTRDELVAFVKTYACAMAAGVAVAFLVHSKEVLAAAPSTPYHRPKRAHRPSVARRTWGRGPLHTHSCRRCSKGCSVVCTPSAHTLRASNPRTRCGWWMSGWCAWLVCVAGVRGSRCG